MGFKTMDGVRMLSADEHDEITRFARDAEEILEYEQNESPENIVKMIGVFIDCAYRDENLPQDSKQELAFSMGSLWAEQVMKKYHWDWRHIDSETSNYHGFFLISEDESYCCPVFQFFVKIIMGNNLYEGENDNTIELIFNMIAELDYEGCKDKFNVIW